MRSLVSALVCFVAFGTFAPASVRAAESDYFWQTGFGQGVLESWVTSGAGSEIRHACADAAMRPNTISFMLNGHWAPGQTVYLDFGYGPEGIWADNGVIDSSSRAGAGTYDWVMDRLKRHSQVRVTFESGESAVFTLRGSSAAIGDCRATFWQ